MIGLALRTLLVLQLCALDSFLVGRAGPLAPDLGVAVVVLAGLRLEASAAWQLLVPLAVGRFALGPEGLALSAALVGASYILVARVRLPLVGTRWQLALVLGFALSLAWSGARAALLSDLGLDPIGRALPGHVVTALVCPGLVLVLEPVLRGLRRVPLAELGVDGGAA
ncbi:MAG: hypothetical protein R3F30_15245 [Planctomycetota bacterium]